MLRLEQELEVADRAPCVLPFSRNDRYTGQEDVVFGSVGDLRQRPELENLVGYCLTPFVVRADAAGDPPFVELLRRLRTESVEGVDHLVPFA